MTALSVENTSMNAQQMRHVINYASSLWKNIIDSLEDYLKNLKRRYVKRFREKKFFDLFKLLKPFQMILFGNVLQC